MIAGATRSDDEYVSPIFPDGLPGKELKAHPPDYQAAAALHWFEINFRPLQGADPLLSRDGTPWLFRDGTPIMLRSSSPEPTADSTILTADSLSPISGRKLVNDAGSALVNDFGRVLVAGERGDGNPLIELSSEFGGLIADDLLRQLGEGLLARSPRWQFIPLPDPLPIELDGVGRLQSEIDAAKIRRDVDELEAHLAAQAATPQAHGQNYWPGAELLDDGLRDETKEVTETVREAASAPVTPIEPVKQSVGRLEGIRNKVGQWIAEGAVRGLAADAAKWGISSAPLWWHWFYHLLSQLLTHTQAWLVSLLGG